MTVKEMRNWLENFPETAEIYIRELYMGEEIVDHPIEKVDVQYNWTRLFKENNSNPVRIYLRMT